MGTAAHFLSFIISIDSHMHGFANLSVLCAFALKILEFLEI